MTNIAAKPDMDGIQAQLQEMAGEIAATLSALDAEASKELLGTFVSDLFLSMAQQSQREARRQRQAEGIAAAKAKGVRFGREPKPVPENFDELHRAWREGRMSLQKAADACGMARGTFYSAALRREQAGEDQAV